MMECTRAEEVWHTYMYTLDGKPFGYAKWRKQGEAAEFHNEMYQHTRSALTISREIFEDIKRDMQQAGCTHVVVADKNENVDAKRLHYWKFMGFDKAGICEGYTFAVMGVSCQQSQ